MSPWISQQFLCDNNLWYGTAFLPSNYSIILLWCSYNSNTAITILFQSLRTGESVSSRYYSMLPFFKDKNIITVGTYK